MKIIILLLTLTILTGCSTNRSTTTLTDDINESIVEGFYDGDTAGLSSEIYLLK